MRLLLVDNYDSFTWNLHDLFLRAARSLSLSVGVDVVRNDAITVREALAGRWTAIVVSPGPCDPDRAGICLSLIEAAVGRLPVFGVCLGHQAIGQVLGGRVVRAPRPVHGIADRIGHAGRGSLAGLDSPLVAMRYHSLVVDGRSLDCAAEVHAWLHEAPSVAMGLRADALGLEGVQFHPESVGTPQGVELAKNVVRWFRRYAAPGEATDGRA
ncbi:MAG: aminodeoxychorismate/anthranilate synthase component II [Deltaproteobacteria bacterium]|nr:aminodeoxychorismate/anthranilate synthase component II [Deltaproteobacteria bacterium]